MPITQAMEMGYNKHIQRGYRVIFIGIGIVTGDFEVLFLRLQC